MAEKFKKVSKEEFIERANKIYNGKYDYRRNHHASLRGQ